MTIYRQSAMVRSVAKNMRAKEWQQAKTEKLKDQLYTILKKSGKSLDEVTKDDLSKKDYEFVVEYVVEVMQCPIALYPNLKE